MGSDSEWNVWCDTCPTTISTVEKLHTSTTHTICAVDWKPRTVTAVSVSASSSICRKA